jgi:cytochrome c-type biogenesis protein
MEFSTHLVVISFLGGVLMFLAPCTLPLVPAFLASVTPQQIQRSSVVKNKVRFDVTVATIMFAIGFTIVFILFGFLAGFFGSKVSMYKLVLSQIGGIFIILFGLSLLNVFHIPLLHRSTSLIQKISLPKNNKTTPVILGSLFAIGWAPCAGPILASILLFTSQSATALQGAFLLFIFSLGLSIPFILVGMLFGYFYSVVTFYEKHVKIFSFLSAFFLILLGIFLTFNSYIVLTDWGFALYSLFGYEPVCSYY